jgi:hypothetical protein
MSSPKNFAFTVYDPATGLPKNGIVGQLSFITYVDDTGVNVTPPAISAVAGGGYQFTPTFPTDHGIYFEIAVAGGYMPLVVPGYLRPEDYAVDSIAGMVADIASLKDFQQGSWEIPTTGPDANRIVFKALDGVTVVGRYDLKHADDTAWVPPAAANTKRVKV